MKGVVLATDGFEDSEFSYPYYRLQESGWDVDMASPDGDSIEGKYGYEFDERDQPIASICHGAQLLISADIVDGRRVTGYWPLEVDIEKAGAEYVDEPVVVDDNLVTSRVPDDLPAFMDAVLRLVDADREAEPAAASV